MRKRVNVTIEDGGIKHKFVIEQMSASKLENWLLHALPIVAPVLGGATLENVGTAILEGGFSNLQNVDVDKAKPLLDEMLECASRIVDGKEYPCSIDEVDGYFTSVKSLLTLRMECLKCNLDFFGGASLSNSQSVETAEAATSTIRIARP